MERRAAIALLTVVVTVGLSARPSGAAPAGLALDPGGFSVDFAHAGQTAVTGDDMLQNGNMEETDPAGRPVAWKTNSYVWLPVADPASQARMAERLKPLMRWESSTEQPHGGKRDAYLPLPRSAYNPGDPVGHEFCAFFHQPLVLPPLAGDTKYVLSYWYRGWSAADVANSRPYVRATFYDNEDPAKAKETRVYAQTIFRASDRWRRGELEFVAPGATRCLDVRLALTGVGEVRFDDVALNRAQLQEHGPTVRLMPGAFLDNLYCLSTGDAGVLTFGFRNETGSKIESPQLLLQLPQGVEVLDMALAAPILEQKPMPVEGASMVQYRLDLCGWTNRIHDGTFSYPYNMWDGLTLVVRTARPAAATRLKASYWLEDGTYRSAPLPFDLQIVPPVPTVAGPKTFRSGAHLFLLPSLTKPEAIQAFAKLYRQVGFNSVHVPPSPLGAELGRLGVERYTQPFANGYNMGDTGPGQKPAEAVFRLEDGQPLWEAICPVEVYNKGPCFRDRIVRDTLRGILVKDRQAEQIMANWEPFMYNGRGCFCDRCQAEFAAFSKLPQAEVDRVWPKTVIQEHGDLWLKFRSWQHGKLMVTLEETVHALGQEAGLDTHFIPEIHYGLLTATWDQYDGNRNYAAVDYLGKLPVLEPWAPYNWFVFGGGPYECLRGLHLSSHVTAREVQDFLAARLPPEQRPQLIAFPYGTYEGATQPEALAFEFLTYFLNGYHGAFAYLFPGGYDARYWRALAEMNRQLALCEPFVSDGQAVQQHDLKCETPLPGPDPRFLHDCGPLAEPQRWGKLPLLLSWEYQRRIGDDPLGDTRLLAVGNFWEQGECFFRLTPRGLRSGRKYVLREPAAGRVYTDQKGRVALAAADLASGVLLHAGAMRFSFFVLEPYREGIQYGQVVRPQDMDAARRERLPAIERAMRAG
jgi:hypothetical protein